MVHTFLLFLRLLEYRGLLQNRLRHLDNDQLSSPDADLSFDLSGPPAVASDRRYSNNSERTDMRQVVADLARRWEQHDSITRREIFGQEPLTDAHNSSAIEYENQSAIEFENQSAIESENQSAIGQSASQCLQSDNTSVDDDSTSHSPSHSPSHSSHSSYSSHSSHSQDSSFHESHDSGNGGVYDPYRPALSRLVPGDAMRLVALPPAAKFRDLVRLVPVGATLVHGLESSRRYKNNLAGVLENILVVACCSEIMMYDLDHLHMPNKSPRLRFDTRPAFTSTAARVILTWPHFPHTINALKVCSSWVDGPAVGVCVDDGSVLVWNAKTLYREMERNKSGRLFGLRLAPDFSLQVDASAWGLDFASACDEHGSLHHVVVVSANSQKVTLLYSEGNGKFAHVSMEALLHNIPDVSVVKYRIHEGKHRVKVCATSILGELVILEFGFERKKVDESESEGNETEDVERGPDNHGESTTSQDSHDPLFSNVELTVFFSTPKLIRQTQLPADGWTCKPIAARYFKPVQSLRAMTGDPSIVEETEMSHILAELRIVNMTADPVTTSHVGGAARWQFFGSPVLTFSPDDTEAKLVDAQVDYNHMRMAYELQCRNIGTSSKYSVTDSPDDVFIAISTDTRLGLMREDSLFCHAATKRLFTLDIPQNEDTRWCDRLLITLLIPDLLCFVAASQSGLVSIMRLCQHRGLYGMRQEHVFPNALSLVVAEHSLRTLIGLCCRNTSPSSEYPRFHLYVVYSDGLVLTYELTAEI